MFAGEISAEEILTSNSEVMELSESDVKNAHEGSKTDYSQIENNGRNKSKETDSLNLVKTTMEINTANYSLTDSSDKPQDAEIIIPSNSDSEIIETSSNSDSEIIETSITDTNNEVEFVKVVETNTTASQMNINDMVRPINLAESTFGLVTEDSELSKPESMVSHSNNTQSKLQSDVKVVSGITTQLDNHLDKSLLTGQKEGTTTGVEITKAVNSLSSLAAEYASSDSDDEEMVPSPTEIITIVDDHDYKKQDNSQYRSTAIHDDSSSEDTNSNSDESDDSTDDSGTETDSEIEVENGRDNASRKPPSKIKKSKSEYEDLPPIQELKITVAEELCERLGEVSGIVEQLVIVRPISGKPTLNLDSVLFLEKGHRVLGQVFDVFGQVADPHYCVRFNSEEHIKKSGIVLGMEVYYSPSTEHTSLVFLHELVKLKGVDISGEDDIEPPEFSDDEEERAYNQLQRQKQRRNPGMNERQENSESEVIPEKRQCHRQRNPWSSDWQSRNYSSPRANRNFGQGPPVWGPENSQPPFQSSYHSQNSFYPSNQPPSNQYEQPHSFDASRYQYNPYNNAYSQSNIFPPPNPGYIFGRPPGFRPNFNSYGSNLYRPGPYQPPPMSWAPPPPPPPPSM